MYLNMFTIVAVCINIYNQLDYFAISIRRYTYSLDPFVPTHCKFLSIDQTILNSKILKLSNSYLFNLLRLTYLFRIEYIKYMFEGVDIETIHNSAVIAEESFADAIELFNV